MCVPGEIGVKVRFNRILHVVLAECLDEAADAAGFCAVGYVAEDEESHSSVSLVGAAWVFFVGWFHSIRAELLTLPRLFRAKVGLFSLLW